MRRRRGALANAFSLIRFRWWRGRFDGSRNDAAAAGSDPAYRDRDECAAGTGAAWPAPAHRCLLFLVITGHASTSRCQLSHSRLVMQVRGRPAATSGEHHLARSARTRSPKIPLVHLPASLRPLPFPSFTVLRVCPSFPFHSATFHDSRRLEFLCNSVYLGSPPALTSHGSRFRCSP